MAWWDDNPYNPNDPSPVTAGPSPVTTLAAPPPVNPASVGPQPVAGTTPATGPKDYGNAILNAIANTWRQSAGREPTQQEVMQWGTDIDPTYLSKIVSTIQSQPKGAAPAAPVNASAGPQPQGLPASGRTSDDSLILSQIAKWAAMPGADPTLGSNPQYWLGRIKETGGLGTDNSQFWQDAGVGDNAFFRHPERESGGATTLSGMGSVGTYTPSKAPDYKPFHLPTQAEVAATPGFQFELGTGLQGIQRGGAAHGSAMSGGLAREGADYATGLANKYYQNAVGNAFSENQANNAGAFGQWQGQENANIAGFGANLSGFNANLGAQNQFWNQGFNENRNAFDQYNTSQNSAFMQWLALANLGNPGNPYA